MNGRSSSLLPGCFSFSLLLLLGGAFVLDTETRAQHKATSHSPDPGLLESGFFYGEDQYYVVTPPLIHVYYASSASRAGTSEKKADVMTLQAPPSHTDYIHEIFVMVHRKWIRKYRQVSARPDGFLTANSCDTANTLDLPGGPLRDALPRSIKIKGIEERRDSAVVVYTDTPDHDDYYSLRTAYLKRDSRSWHVARTVFSGEAMHFCGTKMFPVKHSDEEESIAFLLYLGDLAPRKSNDTDFMSIQTFVLRERAQSFRKQNN